MEGEALLCELPELEPEQEEGRLVCAACERPAPTCWCPHLPLPRPSTNTRVLIFQVLCTDLMLDLLDCVFLCTAQHPAELRRGIRTARMLELGLAPGCCTTVTARRWELPGFLLITFRLQRCSAGSRAIPRSWRPLWPPPPPACCTPGPAAGTSPGERTNSCFLSLINIPAWLLTVV